MSAPRSVAYVHEPFQPERPGILDAGIDRWFAYAPDLDEERLLREYGRMLELRHSFVKQVRADPTVPNLARALRDQARSFGKRVLSDRVLVKDPISALSSAWIADHFDVEVIVLARRPEAFANSIKKKGWEFPFGHLLSQRRLMSDHLEDFAELIEEHAGETRPLVEQAGLLWAIIYHVLDGYLDDRPDWVTVAHEELCLDPVRGFEALYSAVDLEFTERARETVRRHSSGEPVGPSADGSIRRDSRKVPGRWRRELTKEEIETVRRLTDEVSRRLYERHDWSLPKGRVGS